MKNNMRINIISQFNLEDKAIIVPILQTNESTDELEKIAQNYGIDALLLKQDFKADFKEIHVVYSAQHQKVILLGLGKNPNAADIIRAFRKLIHEQKAKLPNSVCIDARTLPEAWVEYLVNGCILGTYDVGLYKTDDKANIPLLGNEGTLNIISESKNLEAFIQKGKAIAETQMQMFDLMNAPANKKIPHTLAKWALASGEKYNYSVKVLEKQQLNTQKLNALLAVGQGSEHPPMLIIMEYRSPKATQTVGLVGKGVTFDTGGISIKSSTNMHLMKSDMGGAAAVFGAIELAAKLELPVHLIGIIPACENAVDGKSFKPSDIINSYSGKTIEVIDTDAEGRLILADGLSYLTKNFKVDTIIDLATLTGSCVATLGYHAAGMFTSNDELADALNQSATETGERLWRLPLWDVYKEDITSDIADVRNYSGKPMAGAISAAKFLEVFTDNHPKWAHLDIAGTAFGDTEFAPQRTGTAFGVRLLVDFLSKI
ncbi:MULTISPECIES: leucyl aminopeptidase [unclassified Arcicella]|uniref:leucyl aminopeptidase family protein n=1 Tax=unclassified Arcicella TaxID=2644986 RepID=UPI0028637241|nr:MULTISPECIES: leucyl aminopeptidase [unclassified Arcicella]MDR6563937.1 leucyl aminopeptidase [Arcicella sp. BE51]MDR6813690.1 leucyl aminopeptidase [Arcicella sp. BE140]MDR6824929.1 leucyl aminopeptidase [Arcicella sp. BE139]